MTKETIEVFRNVVKPYILKTLQDVNYEGMGDTDATEFEKDFNEILDLASKALEQ